MLLTRLLRYSCGVGTGTWMLAPVSQIPRYNTSQQQAVHQLELSLTDY